MNENENKRLRDLVNKCLKETHVSVMRDHEVIFPILPFSLMGEIITFIDNKLRGLLDIYDEEDIRYMILSKIVPYLNYNKLRKRTSNSSEYTFFIPIDGLLPDLLNKLNLADIANNIIGELVNPTKSYALVHLPNVEPGENIKISNGLFLIADSMQDTGDNYFNIDDKTEDFNFPLENNTTYLLIEQIGWNWRIWVSEQPLVYKNILQKFKTFLGLSIIKDIFKTISIPVSESNEKCIAQQFAVFSSVEWFEGMPADCDNPISEEHPDFNDILAKYSEGDELREFCFQKRFFIEDNVNLPQAYIDLLNSLIITEYSTKPSFDQKKGEIVELFPDTEKLESPGQFLRKEFDKIRIILNSNDNYAKRIKNASLWYLEGYCLENDAFKFIDYTIAIESLLGPEPKDRKRDNENIQLSQILSNRCGFSLGKSLKQKEEKQKEFKKIYHIRSRIVHNGKAILNKGDKESLNNLEEITKKLISDAIETYSPNSEEHPTDI